jgi:hypothetical protein
MILLPMYQFGKQNFLKDIKVVQNARKAVLILKPTNWRCNLAAIWFKTLKIACYMKSTRQKKKYSSFLEFVGNVNVQCNLNHACSVDDV